MKTLVIHPSDRSTDFLSEIYGGTDWTIISEDKSSSQIKKLIKSHDRIIMMGHGDENGLFGHGRYVITSKNVYNLRGKSCVYIWCNADVFVRKYNLTGFYTGMIISERDEAMMYSMYSATDEMIEQSNSLFANSIWKFVNQNNRLAMIKEMYVSQDNPIIQFNSVRIYDNSAK